MCVAVVVNDVAIASARELIAYLGSRDRVVMDKNYEPDLDKVLDTCLCPIDLDKTLAANGITFVTDCGDYVVTGQPTRDPS